MRPPLRIPGPVLPGAHIRVISPASATLAHIPARARRGELALTELGFSVSYGRHAGLISDNGATAGHARQRAADLMEAFEDPSVDAVLSADAGLGTRELLDFLDPAALAANPKPFIGSCDNVYVNQYLAAESAMSSLYGCTLMAQLGEAGGAFPETLDYLVRALAGSAPLVCTPVPSRTGEFLNWYIPELEACPRPRSVPGGWTWLRPGAASGPLLGGEITLIPDLISRFSLTLDSAVLFWHFAFHDTPPDQALRALCDCADLSDLAGMIIGAHPAIPPAPWAAQVSDMLDEMLPGLACPVVVNADISNLCPSWTVPYGERVAIDSIGKVQFQRHKSSTAEV
jgi:muramoyltetrapeptide carboxypeptidase LdcA involved in peptidoglycan recycling